HPGEGPRPHLSSFARRSGERAGAAPTGRLPRGARAPRLVRDRERRSRSLPVRSAADRANRRSVTRLLPALAHDRPPRIGHVAGGRARHRAAGLLRDAARPPGGDRRRTDPRGSQRAALPAADDALAARALIRAAHTFIIGAVAQRSERAAYIRDGGGPNPPGPTPAWRLRVP